ncbi:MAG: extracellular solute-binding protein [Treponema sp.]|jgi:ABC-type glycerol-3-phosphate transport system substrate-binding protein|nr:extracellular solute-binding protein [Treponema sp.]
MSLLEKATMINKMYNKKLKKSIHLPERIDIFLVIVILILIITPIIISIYTGKNEVRQETVTLYLSPRFEGLLGRELTEKLIQEYKTKNPDIQFVFSDISGEPELHGGIININLDENPAPDIFLFDEGSLSAYIDNDMLLELNSFTGYDSGFRQLVIPLASFMDLLFYNIEILTAAGFDSPPKTRDDFLAYARRIAGSGLNVSAAALSLYRGDKRALSRDVFSWIWAGGGNFWVNGDNPFLNTRAIINDIAFFGTLNREGLLAPYLFETTGDQRLIEFARGRIAMMTASSQGIPFLRERMKDGAFGITTIPDASTGERYSAGISSIYTAISADCKNINEAWNFLLFLAEKSPFICAELKAVPGMVSSLIPGDYVSDDPYYSKAWEIFEYAQIAESFSGKPGFEKYETIFLEELQVFFGSTRTAQQTVNAIQRRWDEE